MKKAVILIPLFFTLFSVIGLGQTILFSEDFETGELPLNWKQEFVSGSINWRFENGGYSLNPEIPNTRQPISAHGGSYNALFQFQSASNEATKLVTKRIDALEFAIKPELHFFNAQFDWKHGAEYYNDYLRVYFKNSASAPWTLLKEYTEGTTNWVERIILLPENSLSADCYLAFEGETKWGWGACVDDIQIIETGLLQKYLSEISMEQASVVSVSSGTSNNPILKIKLKVMGNSGTLPLNSLVINSLNTTDADIEENGVKLFFTTGSEFNTDHQVGTGVSFTAGQAAFSDLDYDLPTGYSNLWITYDVKASAGHRNKIDAKIPANNINIKGNTYFTAENSPAGSRTILQTIVSDDFEIPGDWIFTGEFEHGSPLGKGGSQGNPDPLSAFNGNYIIGTDLSGLGDYHGDYEKDLITDEYSAISDTIDLTYFNDLSLRYMRYLNIGVNDEAFIKISPDNGKTWKTAWSNTSMILDDTWKLHEVDITNFAARKNKVLIKFSLGATNDYWQLSGWNIDNFSVTGNYVSKDVGISRIISPKSGCGHTAEESVTVIVKNYGATDSYGVIPLKYSLNGKITYILDTLYQIIPFGDSVAFTFKKKANLSIPNIYNFYVSTDMNGDDDQSNNALEKILYIQSTHSANHTENFENKAGLWIPDIHNNTVNWQCGSPGFGIVPPSGSKVWMTRLTANYPDNDSSSIESVCYSNNGNRKVLQLSYWMDAESDRDGVSVLYSLNQGETWQLLDTIIQNKWAWYNDTISSLSSRGWSGNSGGWKRVGVILPKTITDSPSMKFRVLFESDESNNMIGFAMDNFSITTPPLDIGIIQLNGFTDACQYINPDELSVRIQNFGLNALKTNDTIFAGFDIGNILQAVDTFQLSTDLKPGDSMEYIFGRPIDLNAPGNYHIRAYTLNENDSWFYNSNNDTSSVSFEVYPVPVTSLLDTIQTHLPDTVILETIFNSNYDYWWNGEEGLNVYNVKDDGWQQLAVTDTNGCTTYDSTNVELLFYDVGTESLVHPTDNCGFSSHEFPVVRIRNFGTDSITAGQKIAVTFEMNGGTVVEDTLKLSSTLYSGRTVDFTFTKGAVDLSAQGTYDFSVYTAYGGDTITSNNIINKTIEILGRPAVSLGPDITIEDLSHTLDAGSGYESYLWDNGTTSRTREVTESGSFWVMVTDNNACDNTDTAYVRLKIRDISPGNFDSPLSDCEFSANVPVSLMVYNTGTDTVPSGSTIALSYRFNGGSRVNGTMNLSQQLIPGAFAIYPFTGTVDLLTSGDYSLEATAVISGDLRPDNDTAITTIYRYEKPVVDFGSENPIYVEDVSYMLDAGYSPHYAYHWQDTVTTHNYNVTTDGLYHVMAIDNRTSCYDRDSIFVLLIYSDVGVTWTSMPENGCTGEFDDLTIRVSNLGSSSIGSSAKVYVACDVDGERVTLDTLTWTLNFNPGTSIDLPLSGKVSIVNGGISPISFYTIFGEDEKPENDSMKMEFDALPGPVIDFGDVNGALNVDLPHVLDAGAGHQSYEWQDNSENQTYTVNTAGIYSVTVIGQNDCESTKTVSINFTDGTDTFEAGNIVLYPNPSNGLFRIRMENEGNEVVTVRIVNLNGQPVYNREMTYGELENEPIDVQHLARGVFLIQIYTNNQFYTGRVVIQ